LAGGFAHTFNNLLTIIQGFAELAADNARQNLDNSQDLVHIMSASLRARDLVRQMLLFSGQINAITRPLNLNQLVVGFSQRLRPALPAGLSMATQLAADLKTVHADRILLEQMLMQLATNAFQAMPDGGRLTLTTKNVASGTHACAVCGQTLSGDWALLEVSDSGQGMDQPTLARIFEPFFTTREIGQGLGMGLPVVQGIVRGHGGHLECASRLGAGSTFRVYLPAQGLV
jgi:signal transduction histidine kinase